MNERDQDVLKAKSFHFKKKPGPDDFPYPSLSPFFPLAGSGTWGIHHCVDTVLCLPVIL